ncbi:MAG TPA: DUF1015 domain-containing protein [Candidatus Sulfotelmatobacter sp.]|nr:DUF1015 domain-containing protein [Candidatus Sulfotelmatobacter sp.]
MAEVHPFRALRYDTNRVKLADVLTQPYDKITPLMQERYYATSPYNLIAIEKGKSFPDDTSENNVYTRAAQKINEWMAQRILAQDQAPCMYVYSQEYMVPSTHTRKVRIGFIALGRLEDYEAKIVFPHERTLSAPKADRIELLRHTHVQTGQLFMLYDDAPRQIDTYLEETARTPTPLELHDEFEVTHRLWPVTDAAFIRRIQAAMADKKIIIADGHHRYETALNFRNENRGRLGKIDPLAAHEFAMMTFINTHSRGLTILPTHRLIRNVANFDFQQFRNRLTPVFDWYSYPFLDSEERAASYAEFRKDFAGQNHGRRAIGIYPGTIDGNAGAFYLFLLRKDADLETLLPDMSEAQRGLDVVLLHRLILEKGLGITAAAVEAEKNLSYERDFETAIAAVDQGESQLACLLNPVRVQQVVEIALDGGVLPQKSTDFYPKLLSGLAIYRIEGNVDQ